MADSLLRPDDGGTPGGTTAADNLTGGATGQTPSGGGKAVPDDVALLGGKAPGDGDSLDDGGGVDAGASGH